MILKKKKLLFETHPITTTFPLQLKYGSSNHTKHTARYLSRLNTIMLHFSVLPWWCACIRGWRLLISKISHSFVCSLAHSLYVYSITCTSSNALCFDGFVNVYIYVWYVEYSVYNSFTYFYWEYLFEQLEMHVCVCIHVNWFVDASTCLSDIVFVMECFQIIHRRPADMLSM